MADDKPRTLGGIPLPQAKYQRKPKPVDDDYSTRTTLVDYEWQPSGAAKKDEPAAAVLEEAAPAEEDVPEVDVEMEPLEEA